MQKTITAVLLYIIQSASALHADPGALFVQVGSLPVDQEQKVRAWFEKACARSPKFDALVLQDPADSQGNLRVVELEIVDDYFQCFNNVFMGTHDAPWTSTDTSVYVEGIISPQFRWEQIYLARSIADKLLARYPSTYFHWYISYEANLGFFIGQDVRTNPNIGTPITGASVRDAYIAYLLQLSTDLYSKKPRSILWSPTFWSPYASLSATEANELEEAIRLLFLSVPKLNWIHFQDFVGQATTINCLNARSCYPRVIYPIGCDNTVSYYQLLKDASVGSNINSLGVNMEMFITQKLPNNKYGIMPADKNELMEREACYARNGVPIGASWEIRWWYLSYYGLPVTDWLYPAN